VPRVNADRLLADLQALAGDRFSETGRNRARQYIMQSLLAAGWTPQQHEFIGGINLYAERQGSDATGETLLIGAHYDAVQQSPGADDNATAVAAVLEIARLFADYAGVKTLQLVFFDQEEAGLVGSFNFVRDKVAPDRFQGAIILEMLGYACQTAGCQQYPSMLPITPPTTQGNFLAVIGDQGHMSLIDSFVHAGQPALPQVLTLPVPLLGPLTPHLLRSDHAPFWQQGLGAVMVTDTANFRNPHYHQQSDTPDTIDPEFFVGSTQLVVNAVSQLLTSKAGAETQGEPQRHRGHREEMESI
jgi:Zn-dependent M28 family amino/carboxypeptidase